MYPSKNTQIAHPKADEGPTKVSSKYADFANVFSIKLAVKLPDNGINNFAIKLVDDRQPPYGPIYSLGPMELEILKAYIENNLANGFIRSSNSPARPLIIFDKKQNSHLRLYVDYQGFNNLTIKN